MAFPTLHHILWRLRNWLVAHRRLVCLVFAGLNLWAAVTARGSHPFVALANVGMAAVLVLVAWAGL